MSISAEKPVNAKQTRFVTIPASPAKRPASSEPEREHDDEGVPRSHALSKKHMDKLVSMLSNPVNPAMNGVPELIPLR